MMYNNVTVEIVEQPRPNSMRFRYSCEGQTAGSILGVNSTDKTKTYPSIRVLNYEGTVRVCVSCVTVDGTPKSHPNRLIGKRCNSGVCTTDFTTKAVTPLVFPFPQLGIQCPKVMDVAENLEERMKLNVDPFKTGFEHKARPKTINLHKLRLCFQVFLMPDPTNEKNLIPLPPVVSDVISDKQRTPNLSIYETSDCSSPPCGGKKIMILCDKVDKRDIRIQFYEKGADDSFVWMDWANFQPRDVHQKIGISFRTPKYRDQNITKPVNVFFRLQAISDGTFGEPFSFAYVPDAIHNELPFNSEGGIIEDSAELYDYVLELEAGNHQMSKNMSCDIEPSVAVSENIPTERFNIGASEFYQPNNNTMPTQRFHADCRWTSAPVDCEQAQYYNQQQHYETGPQLNMESNYGNFAPSSVSEFGNAYGSNAMPSNAIPNQQNIYAYNV